MYILVTNGKSYVTFPWLREIACRNYKGETMVFTTKQFSNFLESLNGDYSLIKGLTILTPLEGGYKFIENCNFLQQLYIFDSIAKINIKLSNLVLLRQMVIHCREFEGIATVINLLENKIKCFEKDINEDNPKLSQYTLVDMAIKNIIDINKNEIDKIRKSPIFRGELIINSKHILTEFELSLRDKYIERQKYIEKNKNRGNGLTRAERKALIKKMFDES